MYLEQSYITFLICLDLLLLGLVITIDLALFSLERYPKEDEERDIFLDSEGNHIYYERSIIKKKAFFKTHPKVSPQQLRTWRRLFKELFYGSDK